MTRVEMREARKKQFRRKLIISVVLFLLSFMLGAFSHWCFCKLNHEDVQKVEHFGSVTIYVVENPLIEETKDDKEPENYEEIIPDEELPPEEEFVSFYTYTEEELDLLSRLIYSEGGTESYETKLKIGSVVMNRVSDPDFPDTIREVIYQKNQFSVTTHKIDGVIMIDRPADEESKRAAKEVLDYGSILPPDVQVFYAKYISNVKNWVISRKVYEVCDNTVFAYIYKG